MAHNYYDTECPNGHRFQVLTLTEPRCPVCAGLVPATGTFIDRYGYERLRTSPTASNRSNITSPEAEPPAPEGETK